MNVENQGPIVVVAPQVQRLDAGRADSLRSALGEALERGSRLVLDLDGVELVDSTSLGVLVGILRRLPEGGAFMLCGLSENVGKVMHLTRLDRILPIYPSSEEAVAALQ